MEKQSMEQIWPVRLFKKSILKQTKFEVISKFLGSTTNLNCLDIGSDNGVFSYLLRQKGGRWKSADLDERSVNAMKELVKTEVYQIDGGITPFQTDEFDCVVIVDFLEHIPDDKGFLEEVYRILKPGGKLIVNAPNIKPGLLMKFRQAISINSLLGDRFALEEHATYTKFFSKFIDTIMVFLFSKMKKFKRDKSMGRGVLVTGKEMKEYKRMFRFYSLVYPVLWLFAQLDHLLVFNSGYMLIARAHSNKLSNYKEETRQDSLPVRRNQTVRAMAMEEKQQEGSHDR
jgi:2-polyprenyl-3-methyl-5-hydroxy-6-metoxy-1,4-benzoquinol methylase